ncbi:replication-relaxation family protein (plasmid) [Streptomyces sp. BI20]|uniref:replication-relaxation family protein n=1 Tax=Streptomyces sp. BI20 TaxID=3403460 RepID=UPI003C79007D
MLGRLRIATPDQLRILLTPDAASTSYVRKALGDLAAERLVERFTAGRQSYWACTPTGLAEVRASGEAERREGRTTGQRAAGRTGLRGHALAVTDTAIALHTAGHADHTDWRVEVAHPTPAGRLVADALVLLADGDHAFVEVERTTTNPAVLAKLDHYSAYLRAPATGRGSAAYTPRPPWQETYAPALHGRGQGPGFPLLLFVFAPGQGRPVPETREHALHAGAQVRGWDRGLTVATTTLARLDADPAGPVWHVLGTAAGEVGLPGVRRAR